MVLHTHARGGTPIELHILHISCTEVAPLGRTHYCATEGGNHEHKTGGYAPEFKQQLIELHRAGRLVIDLTRDFGCHKRAIADWVRQAKADEKGGVRPDAPLTNAERQELSRLRRELRQVTLERDLLAKATA